MDKADIETKIIYRNLEKIKPYERNPRRNDKAVPLVANSIKRFGFKVPIVIDKDGTIVTGHTRYKAAKQLGLRTVPCIIADDLTPGEIKAFRLADNKVSEVSEWDDDLLKLELLDLQDSELFDTDTELLEMESFGFLEENTGGADWFENRERFDVSKQDGNDEYNEFLDKFEIPKTTDDCYTPDLVYDAVADWVANEYNVERKDFVRPFYPGGDYQTEKYKKTDIVVDNPPFSILSEILKFYTEKGVRFFLFAPALTLFSSSSSSCCAIGAGAQIVYENKANVSTSFLTNLEMEYRFRTAPTLYKAVQDAVDKINEMNGRELARNNFPDEVVTSTKLSYFSRYGVDFKVRRCESEHIRALDAQKETKQTIFGSGYLISEKAAAEKAAAEKAAAEKAAAEKAAATVWKLSERERQIIQELSNADT